MPNEGEITARRQTLVFAVAAPSEPRLALTLKKKAIGKLSSSAILIWAQTLRALISPDWTQSNRGHTTAESLGLSGAAGILCGPTTRPP